MIKGISIGINSVCFIWMLTLCMAAFHSLRRLIINKPRFAIYIAVTAYLGINTYISINTGVSEPILGVLTAINVLIAIAMQMIYLFVFLERDRMHLATERTITELQSKIMLTQIQPHFIFNSLSSIMLLVKKSPQDAAHALADFSEYLRHNIDRISSDVPIPFADELNHVQIYVRLEKLRFKDRLEVEYDINETDFILPPLTIQPLVENAIKHGVTKRPEGGKVTLRTLHDDKGIHIVVEDNGVGFDPLALKDDDAVHVGLENVRTRIGIFSGIMNVESNINVGTRIEILIPA